MGFSLTCIKSEFFFRFFSQDYSMFEKNIVNTQDTPFSHIGYPSSLVLTFTVWDSNWWNHRSHKLVLKLWNCFVVSFEQFYLSCHERCYSSWLIEDWDVFTFGILSVKKINKFSSPWLTEVRGFNMRLNTDSTAEVIAGQLPTNCEQRAVRATP